MLGILTDDRPRMQGSMVFMWHWKSSRWPLSQPVLLPLDELYSRHFRQFGWSFFFLRTSVSKQLRVSFSVVFECVYVDVCMFHAQQREEGRKEGKVLLPECKPIPKGL